MLSRDDAAATGSVTFAAAQRLARGASPILAAIAVLATAVYSEIITRYVPAPGPVHVTYWEKWTGFEDAAMRNVVAAYNASQHRVHVDMLTVSSVENKTLLAISAGDPPDVAGLYGPNVAQYADDNAIIPLDSYISKAGIREQDYVPSYWRIGAYRGHVYALPSTPASTALHINTDLFRRAGLDPARPPRTTEQLLSDCDALTRRDASGRIVTAGFLPAEPGWWDFGWGYLFGGRLWDGHDRLTANSPENIRGLEWVAAFARRFGAGDLQSFRSGFGNFSSPQNAFLSGKVAMELQGVWMSNFIQKYAPAMDSPRRTWVAVPFPYPADRPDLANSTFVDEDILVVPRGARHPDEAFDFIRFVQARRGMELLCLGQKKHTPLISVSPGFYEHHPNPFIRLFAALPRGKNAYNTPQIGIWPQYHSELTNAVEQVELLQKTPAEALNEVQERMQPLFDEYRKRLRMRSDLGL